MIASCPEVARPLGERWATGLECSRTGATAPLDAPASLSPAGAPWLVRYRLDPSLGPGWRQALSRRPWTAWRYRELLPVAHFAERVDLGEGGTPLIPLRRLAPPGIRAWVKEEGGNPSGSFKARGLSMAVNRARELGAQGVELASAGNAAIALAQYAAACGMPARVALPQATPATVEERCRAFGAEVVRGGSTLVEARQRLAAAGEGFSDLSTFREPYRVEGKKTMGLELAEQLGWELPEWIVYPTGGGTGIVGMAKAFHELRQLGLAGDRLPRLAAVQMAGCAPLVRAFRRGAAAAAPWQDVQTQVWGLRVPRALAGSLVLAALRESGGEAVTVREEEVPRMAARAAREEGLLVGPEGAAALAGLQRLAREGKLKEGERVVVFQTGHPDNYR
ncbi:MAG TPA: threonine synthase [Thermoanaerobaculia bacterium]|nr:threonine synthase [Thermoanaerobaculia bacterium]